MRLEDVTAEIRPRSDWEAVDLGVALARRDFWRCFAVWWLTVLVPTALAGWWLWESPVMWLLLFWWWKPAASRVVLFELSRRLFGNKPMWSETLRRVPGAFIRRFFHRFILGRLSPWLPVTLAVEELEGLRGKAHKLRRTQIARRGESAVVWLYLIADLAAAWFGLAILALVWMFIPQGQEGAWRNAIESWSMEDPTEIPHLIMRVVVVCMMLSISITDVFVTGAGFGIYLNNRTWLEGWDVELAFRRLGVRLGGAALPVICLCLAMLPVPAFAGEPAKPAEIIRRIVDDPDFKEHTVTIRVPKERKKNVWDLPDLGSLLYGVAQVVFWLIVIALFVSIVWLLWKNRGSIPQLGVAPVTAPAKARVVMGMDVSPETLPADIPAEALVMWRQGRHQEALSLLYRGAISRVIENSRVEIRESDTEGDCLRRVRLAGQAASPDYFRDVSRARMELSYARRDPGELPMEVLCRDWPYAERRNL